LKKKINILIVDDEKEILKSLNRILEHEGYNCFTAISAEEAMLIMSVNYIDIVLADIKMPGGMDGMELLREIRNSYPYIHVIMLTAYGTIDSSIEAIRLGAFGYLLKPFNVEEILNEIKKVQKLIILEKENREFRKRENEEFFIFESRNSKMQSIYNLISNKIAKAESIVLLQGESGTGKEIIAEYIHNRSGRSKGPFVRVSCAALSEGLLESELFGHVKGSFTGAIKDKIGRFEAANSGTIFLDEIGDFSTILQLKLLRVLQEKTIEPVGQNEQIEINTRIIVATNKNLETLVKENRFREDLFYRVNIITIDLPPLRDRKEDIPVFVELFVKKHSHKNNINISHIEEKALDALVEYNWPGNIRELENVIERSVIFSDNGIISYNSLDPKFYISDKNSEDVNSKISNSKKAFDMTEKLQNDFDKITSFYNSLNNKVVNLKSAREYFEKEFIIKALKRNKGNVSKTSKELGLARKNLYEKMKKYSI